MDWLPDSRLSPALRTRRQIVGPDGQHHDAVFCCNCGRGPLAVVSPHAIEMKFLCKRCEKFGQAVTCCRCGAGPFPTTDPIAPGVKWVCPTCERSGPEPGEVVVRGISEPRR